MPWYEHPAYRPLRDRLIDQFRIKTVAFRHLKHVVFLCGGFESDRRVNLFQYLRRWATAALVFQADDVWAQISTQLNALQMETLLAELADAIVIIVESPGTFAELGTFSNHPTLRNKLLPIHDVKYREDNSFSLDHHSDFRTYLYGHLELEFRRRPREPWNVGCGV